MDLNLDQATAVLRRTPGVVRAMLGGLDDAWVHGNCGPETFSPYDVVGHLIHGERADWVTRLRTILEHGASRPFDPFDRFAMYEESRDKSLAELLDTFETLRARNLDTLGSFRLTEADFERPGRHPALGPVTLRNLLATWVAHDMDHLHQIAETIAYQYLDEVGPWRRFLMVLPQADVEVSGS